MRHPLNFLLRVGRSDDDRLALLGDLAEACRERRARGSGPSLTVLWYTSQVLWAAVRGIADATVFTPPAILSDARYALRRWRHRPGFAITAIVTLGLGVAAATSIFSIVDAVLLRPLPWTNPETLVVVHGVYPDRRNNPPTAPTWNRYLLTYPGWDALRTASSFEAVAAYRHAVRSDMTFGEDRTRIITPMDVSSTFLPLLGVRITLGRHFNDREDNSNSDSLILTHETWRRDFGGRLDVIGERVMSGSASSGGRYPKTIVGVIEPGFRFDGMAPDVLQPIGIPAETLRTYPSPALRVIARLAPGADLSSADAQAAGLVSAARNDSPAASARVVRLEDEQLGSSRRPLWLLFGGAGLLLLIACSNVAGLLLGEARVRRHEIAVRGALGGSRARVLRQLVVEHVLLAVAGAVAGWVAAHWMTSVLVALAPSGLPRIETTTIDSRSTMFAIACGLLTLLTFGVAPAVTLARTPIAGLLAEGGRDLSVGRLLGQRLIVIGQVALALVLLTGATLFGETMLKLNALPLGFDPERVAVVATTFTGSPLAGVTQDAFMVARRSSNPGLAIDALTTEIAFARNRLVLERLDAIPGVAGTAFSTAVPFVLNPGRQQIVPDGRPDTDRYEVGSQRVSSRYFATMGIALLRGRTFELADAAGPRVVVVSEEFERRFFPEGAINRQFKMVYGERYDLSVTYRIIGVVADVKRQERTDDDRPLYYGYDRQSIGASGYFVIKSSLDPLTLLPTIRRTITDVSPQVVVTSTTTLGDRVQLSVVEERFRATLSVIFGTAALILATVGLYGLAARRVADRRREFGVRVALGARPGDVRGLVMRDAVLMVGSGLAAGLPGSWAIARIAQSLLFDVTASSPHVFVLSVSLLAVVVLAAPILPARRAARIDPVVTLRSR